MAIAFVQWAAKGGASAASITTTAITTAAGNLLVAVPFCDTNKIGTTPITDSKSNTWTSGIAAFGSTTFAGLWYAANCLGGASHTFTFTPTSSDFIALAVFEISGAALSSVLNGTSTSVTNTASHASGNITASASVQEFWVGAWNPATLAASTPANPDSPWVWNWRAPGGSAEGALFGYRIANPSTVGQFSLTANSAAASPILVAGFKSATAPATQGGFFIQ